MAGWLVGARGGWGPPNTPPAVMAPSREKGGGECVSCPAARRFFVDSWWRDPRGKAARMSMTSVWALAALWLGLAVIAGLFSIWLRVSTALSEIMVGATAQLIFSAFIGSAVLGADEGWVKFLAGIGAIVLTFLAGAELDPIVFRLKWKEAAAVGLASFLFPFLGCAAGAHVALGLEMMPGWLAGVAMSTTSVRVVYAVLLDVGFHPTRYAKAAVAAPFRTQPGP